MRDLFSGCGVEVFATDDPLPLVTIKTGSLLVVMPRRVAYEIAKAIIADAADLEQREPTREPEPHGARRG